MYRTVTALCCAALAPGAFAGLANESLGQVTFTFEDPTQGREFSSGGGMPAELEYDSDTIITLTVETSLNPGGTVTNFDASLAFDVEIGTPVFVGMTTIAPISGSFTFTDADSGLVIFTAAFGEGQFVTFNNAGSLLASADGEELGLDFEAGPALQAIDIPALDAIDAVFTLTDIDILEDGPLIVAPPGEEPSFNAFRANSAFSATADIVPAPGALVLSGLALLGASRRRRH